MELTQGQVQVLGKSSLEQQQSWMEPEPRGRLQLWGQSRAAGAGFCPGTAVFGTRSEPSTYLPQGCFDSVEPLPQPGDRNSPGQLHNLISFGPVLRTKDRFLYKPVEGPDSTMLVPVLLGSLTGFAVLGSAFISLWLHHRRKTKSLGCPQFGEIRGL